MTSTAPCTSLPSGGALPVSPPSPERLLLRFTIETEKDHDIYESLPGQLVKRIESFLATKDEVGGVLDFSYQ
jgi:hypothetical protein